MRYLIVEEDQAIGIVDIDEGKQGRVMEAFSAQGMSLEETAEAQADQIDLSGECEEGDERPCELSVALGFASDLGKEAGVSTAEVDAIIDRMDAGNGVTTEKEVRQAVCSVVGRLPEDMQGAGEGLMEAAFGSTVCQV